MKISIPSPKPKVTITKPKNIVPTLKPSKKNGKIAVSPKFKTITNSQIKAKPKVNISIPKSQIKKIAKPNPSPTVVPKIPIAPIDSLSQIEGLVNAHGETITLDKDQIEAVKLALNTDIQAMCITGLAGTGKTTVVQAIVLKWLENENNWFITQYRNQGVGTFSPAPSIAIVAATNRAADNMRDKLVVHHKLGKDGYEFGPNVTTCHNLLEYTCEWIYNDEGNKIPRYFPKKDSFNKLNISHLILEESTLVGATTEATHFNWEQLRRALPPTCKILFLGDLNQLPPVIGKSILNYAVQQLDISELTKIHRQAWDNPIIKQAHNCIYGKAIEECYYPESDFGVRIFHGKANFKLTWQQYEFAFKRLITKIIEANQFDPMVDMILSPFNKISNKAVSAQNLANVVGTILASKQDTPTPVYEIIAGFRKFYLRVGDRVYCNKQEAIVTSIGINSSYYGRKPIPESIHLDYFGQHSINYSNTKPKTKEEEQADWEDGYTALSLDEILESDTSEEERKKVGSHSITVRWLNSEEGVEATFSTVGELNEIQLGYALSVHKAQGSEWPRVILALHDSNTINLYRELVYTAMTRPQKRLDIIAQPHVLRRATVKQRIKGHTLAAKIEFFNSGYLDQAIKILPDGANTNG